MVGGPGKVSPAVYPDGIKDLASLETVHTHKGGTDEKGRHHDHIEGKIVIEGKGADKPVVPAEFVTRAASHHVGKDGPMGLRCPLGSTRRAGRIDDAYDIVEF